MNRALIDRVARAVLYEGYVLYPYRPSSLKNSRRLTFGTLYPAGSAMAQSGGERSYFQAQCLLKGSASTTIAVLARFLHLNDGSSGEAMEREVTLDATLGEIAGSGERKLSFSFPAGMALEAVEGEIRISAAEVSDGTFKLTLVVRNMSAGENLETGEALARSLASAHAAISVKGGELVSVTDPPAHLTAAAAACVNTGVWPVLVGEPGSTDTVLASPIILPDYPQVAPESSGDLYDATEIEEILALRVLTLTDEEKEQARLSEPRARRILERAESLPAEHMMRLHGVIRGLAPTKPEPWSAWDSASNSVQVATIVVDGSELKAGDRVRLNPRKRADIFDLALEGRIAVIEAIEQDLEDNVHLAVVIEDDPGRDLGEMRQAGHRFFFSPQEVEPVERESGSVGAGL